MKEKVVRNLHFYISIPVVATVALVYAFEPNVLFDIQPNTTDEHNVYKAIMGLYLAFASFWGLALVQNQYWRVATLSNMIFMLGLSLGRFVSFATDGLPSPLLLLGSLGELTLAAYAAYLLRKNN